MRPDRDTLMMSMAHMVATRGTCPRASVGCVVARDGRPLSLGYNGAPPRLPHCTDVGCLIPSPGDGCRRAVHAEANAIAWAARNGVNLGGAAIYCTYSPCTACALLVLAAGIVEFHFFSTYRDTPWETLSAGGCAVIQH